MNSVESPTLHMDSNIILFSEKGNTNMIDHQTLHLITNESRETTHLLLFCICTFFLYGLFMEMCIND